MKLKSHLAWHFTNGKTLRNGDPLPPDGVWLEFKGPLKMCESGLHFSRLPFDALQYAPGEFLHLVEVGGKIVNHTDKGVCTRRRSLCRFNATEVLYYFARQQALSMVHLWEAPDVVLDYLMGDEAARGAAAREAARGAAAWDAAWDAARADFNALVYECFEGPLSIHNR